jgi:peptidoglycan/LPS O-acetylase OafA/YrhL
LSPHDRVVQLIGYPLSAVACAGLVAEAIAGSREQPLGRVLGGTPLTFLGRYSYGIYMYHVLLRPTCARVLPLAAGHGVSYPAACGLYMGISFAASLLIAWLSYHLYEAPFLRLKTRFAY